MRTLCELVLIAILDIAATHGHGHGEHAVGAFKRRAQLSGVCCIRFDQVRALLCELLGICGEAPMERVSV